MDFYKRDLEKLFVRYKKFPVVAILGPRQSGKTTIAKHHFKNHQYINLEVLEMREFARADPQKFLRDFENNHGMIIDEFQYVPELLSYIQVQSDEKDRPGYFVLTGSQNFLMNQAITQSLAGRVGILTLLPLSLHELEKNRLLRSVDQMMLDGAYPRLYKKDLSSLDFYPSYIRTYIERDVRQLTNIGDMAIFEKFLRLCAGRIGELLNIAEIATQVGVDQRTIKKWLSVLEASYIIFLLQPHHKNYNKRLIKTPKLYFYDTGVACSLLGIQSKEVLSLSPFRGHLFESLIISDFMKQYANLGYRPSLYFWRDMNGRIEVDCIVDNAEKLTPIEIKSGETIQLSFFDSLLNWNGVSETTSENNYIVYAGDRAQHRTKGNVVTWKDAATLIDDLIK